MSTVPMRPDTTPRTPPGGAQRFPQWVPGSLAQGQQVAAVAVRNAAAVVTAGTPRSSRKDELSASFPKQHPRLRSFSPETPKSRCYPCLSSWQVGGGTPAAAAPPPPISWVRSTHWDSREAALAAKQARTARGKGRSHSGRGVPQLEGTETKEDVGPPAVAAATEEGAWQEAVQSLRWDFARRLKAEHDARLEEVATLHAAIAQLQEQLHAQDQQGGVEQRMTTGEKVGGEGDGSSSSGRGRTREEREGGNPLRGVEEEGGDRVARGVSSCAPNRAQKTAQGRSSSLSPHTAR